MSHANPTHGKKVTTDPAGRRDPIVEGAGPVTSDSLAAESIRQHGGFSQNRDAAPLGVTSENSTLNNTDTSAATELRPAKDAETRAMLEEQERGANKEDGNELGRSAIKSGTELSDNQLGSTEGSAGGPTGGSAGVPTGGSTGGSTEGKAGKSGKSEVQERDASAADLGSPGGPQQKKQKQNHGEEDQPKDIQPAGVSGGSEEKHGKHHGNKHGHKHPDEVQGGTAPTYVDVDVVHASSHSKPKGKNLKEGGFDDDAPNASGTTEIGSEEDPGRAAEQKLQGQDGEDTLDAGSGSHRKVVTDDGRYDALPSEEQA